MDYHLIITFSSLSAAIFAAISVVVFIFVVLPHARAAGAYATIVIVTSTAALVTAIIGTVISHGFSGYFYRVIKRGINAMRLHRFQKEELDVKWPLFHESQAIIDELRSALMEQGMMELLKQAAARGYMLNDVLEEVFPCIDEILDIDRIGVAFVDQSGDRIIAEHGILKRGETHLVPVS